VAVVAVAVVAVAVVAVAVVAMVWPAMVTAGQGGRRRPQDHEDDDRHGGASTARECAPHRTHVQRRLSSVDGLVGSTAQRARSAL